MIFSSMPTDWRDLQKKVAKVFTDIGFTAEIERELKTARGSVKVDVYADDSRQTPSLVYICECKYWASRVSQSTVHAFRSVVSDCGANYGMLISKIGFQRGCYDVANHTNIQLFDWQQFQQLFEDRWFWEFMIPTMLNEGDALHEYTEPINSMVFREAKNFNSKERKRFMELREQYQVIAYLPIPYYFLHRGGFSIDKFDLPLEDGMPSDIPDEYKSSMLPSNLVKANAFQDFLDIWLNHVRQGTKEFDELFGKQLRSGFSMDIH